MLTRGSEPDAATDLMHIKKRTIVFRARSTLVDCVKGEKDTCCSEHRKRLLRGGDEDVRRAVEKRMR